MRSDKDCQKRSTFIYVREDEGVVERGKLRLCIGNESGEGDDEKETRVIWELTKVIADLVGG